MKAEDHKNIIDKIFNKVEENSCVKDYKWYRDLKKEVLE